MTTPRKEQPWQDAPVSIRIFDAETQSTNTRGLSPRMTLSEFFEAFFVLVWCVERRSAATNIKEYRRSIEYWAKFTGDPPLDEIDDWSTAAFLKGLWDIVCRGKALSPHTIRKHCRHVQTVLSLAGPRSRTHRKAQRLLAEVPYIDMPPVDDETPDENFTLDEIGALLDACPTFTYPKRRLAFDRTRFLQTLITTTFNVGERRGAMLGVRFADLRDDDPRFPNGRLAFPRGIRKGRVKSNLVPLNPWAREAIELARRGRDRELAANPQAKIWPWPFKLDYINDVWQLLCAHAELPLHRRFGLHGLRKAAATELADISPLAAQQLLKHSDIATTNRSYVQQRKLGESLNVMPQPKRKRADYPDQRRLFE